MIARLSAVVVAALLARAAAAEPSPPIQAVVAHPLFSEYYSCIEHAAGQLQGVGDDLGTDCYVQRLIELQGRKWMRAYRNEGLKNDDWFGWGSDVLAPCTGTIKAIRENKVTNQPGILGKPPASWVEVSCADGVHFIVAHIVGPAVAVGDGVHAGQKIAQVGNNGMSRHPHIHLGAWKGKVPLQIRFDQTKMPVE